MRLFSYQLEVVAYLQTVKKQVIVPSTLGSHIRPLMFWPGTLARHESLASLVALSSIQRVARGFNHNKVNRMRRVSKKQQFDHFTDRHNL